MGSDKTPLRAPKAPSRGKFLTDRYSGVDIKSDLQRREISQIFFSLSVVILRFIRFRLRQRV